MSNHTLSFLSVPGDAPTQITSVPLGPESVRVTWAPPRQPNGQILNYTIYYSPSSFNVTVMGGATSQDLDMLVPFTRYSIRLSASTSAGEGPLSLEEVTVRTEQDGEDDCYCIMSYVLHNHIVTYIMTQPGHMM